MATCFLKNQLALVCFDRHIQDGLLAHPGCFTESLLVHATPETSKSLPLPSAMGGFLFFCVLSAFVFVQLLFGKRQMCVGVRRGC